MPVQQFVEHLRRAISDESATDAELLTAFIGERSESAFAELVRRHGPMVWGVCWRLLPHRQDVEDCYQATFLVLVRRADSVRPQARLGAWLHGVAYHTALKARQLATKRGFMERQLTALPESAVGSESADELRQLLDRGLREIPERYRHAIVLCELEGRSIQDAARELNCPVGTLAGWLSRGRDLLGRRLMKLGAPFSAAALAAFVTEQASAAPPVVNTTAASSSVAALADATMRSLTLAKVKLWFFVAAAALVLACTLGGWMYHVTATPVPVDVARAPQLLEVLVPDKDPVEIPKDTAWGQDVDGVRYGIAIKERRDTFVLGESVTFVLKAKNMRDVPTRFAQVDITGCLSTAKGAYGAAIATMVDAQGKSTNSLPMAVKGVAPAAKTREVQLAAGEEAILGEVAYTVGKFGPPTLGVGPGRYRVSFDTVCWLKGHQRPTGILTLNITDGHAWGKAVEGVEYGFHFRGDQRTYRVGDDVHIVFKARNTTAQEIVINQIFMKGIVNTVNGMTGVVLPTAIDSQGKTVTVHPVSVVGAPLNGASRHVILSAGSTHVIGEVTYSIAGGLNVPRIVAGPGKYQVRFDTVCWLKGNQRPTGSLEISVLERLANPKIAWGPAQGDVEFGVSMAANQSTFEIGDKFEFQLHARNVGKIAASFEQFRIAPENEPFRGGADPLLLPAFESVNGQVTVGEWNLPAGAVVSPPKHAVKLAPGESVQLGTIDWQAKHPMRELYIDPGHYTVHFKSVMQGVKRPTGKLPVRVVLPASGKPAPGWGKEVDGLRFNVGFKNRFNTRHVGSKATFVLKATNVTDKPITFEQIGIIGAKSFAKGTIGAAVPVVVDEKGMAVPAHPLTLPGEPAMGEVRTLKIAAGETIVLGEVEYAIGANVNPPRIEANPGRYQVRFDTVCWLPGHQRPTGTTEFIVLPKD